MRYHAAAETPRGAMAANETGASSGFAPPFPVSSRRHLQTRVPPRASTETTAPVSSHARTSVTASPCAWPRNAAARAKVTREETPRRARRGPPRTRARPPPATRSPRGAGERSPRGVPRPESAESPSCVPSARFMRGRAHVAEKYAGDAECASRARELSARPESTSSSTGARRQRCARAHARGRALSGCRVEAFQHPHPHSAVRPERGEEVCAAARGNSRGAEPEGFGFGYTRSRTSLPPASPAKTAPCRPLRASRGAAFTPRAARLGAPREPVRGDERRAVPGRPRVRLHDHGLREAHRRIGRDAPLAAGPHAVHTRAAPSSEVVTSATVFVKEIEAVPRERKASGVSGVSSFQRADVTAVGCRRVCAQGTRARVPDARETRAPRRRRDGRRDGRAGGQRRVRFTRRLRDDAPSRTNAEERSTVRRARSRGLSASSRPGAPVSSTRHARSSPSAAAETNAVPSLVQAAATTFAAHLARPTLSHARRRERGEEREGALVSSVSSSSSRSAGA